MKKMLCNLVILATIITGAAYATETTGTVYGTEAIGTGKITGLTFRNNYLVFTVESGTTNFCAACPGDPSGYSSAGHCYVPGTDELLASFVLTAATTDADVSGRILGWTACEDYQLTVQ